MNVPRRGWWCVPRIGIPELALATLVLQNTFLILFMRYSRTQQGPMYAASTAVVCMEVVKFVTCFVVLCFIPSQGDIETNEKIQQSDDVEVGSNSNTGESII